MVDLHVHTRFSCDSKAHLDGYCRQALSAGVRCICFTDHVDFNPSDDGFGYYDAEGFFREFRSVRERYADKLTLLSGIEFSEPHIYPAEFDRFRSLPYDFILGSVHYWIDGKFPSRLVEEGHPVESVFERYWEEVRKAVRHGGFDSLAHPDFPARFFGVSLWSADMMKDIFRTMRTNGIALEINTSSLRKGLPECLPDRDLLSFYSDSGGRDITIGSDAHRHEELASGYAAVKSRLPAGLRSVIFVGRSARPEPGV
jgi:histidinol-phosphatase (PHP family)